MKYPEIYINERFGITRDRYQFVLFDYNEGRIQENGKPKTPKTFYFNKIEHMARPIVDRALEGADSLEDLHSRLAAITAGDL